MKYGVDKADIFQTNDLFERKDLGAVTNTIFALDRAVKHLLHFASVKHKDFLRFLRKSYVWSKLQCLNLPGRTTSRVDGSEASGRGGGTSKRLLQPVKRSKETTFLFFDVKKILAFFLSS